MFFQIITRMIFPPSIFSNILDRPWYKGLSSHAPAPVLLRLTDVKGVPPRSL